MEDKYYILDGILVKNPKQEDIDNIDLEKCTEIVRGHIKGMIFECWWINIETNSCLDFQYSSSRDAEDVISSRIDFFKRHGVKPISIRTYILPPDYFTEEGVRIPDAYK